MLPADLSSVLESYGNVGITNDFCKQKIDVAEHCDGIWISITNGKFFIS
jgi:hypothetical protein